MKHSPAYYAIRSVVRAVFWVTVTLAAIVAAQWFIILVWAVFG